MNIPEVEVRTFKQQGGESLKDAWYRICDAHYRCTKKYSTMILLRNFYVGISAWNRYALDTLVGGNFLGAPATEAYTLIESLVGSPPTNVTKTENTIEEVVKRLESLEKTLPNFLYDATHTNELIGNIDKRVNLLESVIAHDDSTVRIGKLEKVMETLSSTFSSLDFKKEKAFVGIEQKFMYKTPKPKTKSGICVVTSSGMSKTLDTTNGVDASSFENT
jgi:hypothetical protein